MTTVGKVWSALALALALSAAGFVLLLSVGAPPALADTFTFDLPTGNSGGLSCCTGPYAQVMVDLTSSTVANITFDSLTNGGYTYLMGDGSSAGVNVNATTFTLSGISGTNSLSGFTPGSYTIVNPPGTSNVDGFGLFNGSIDSFDGFTHSATEIAFTLTNTSGTWSSASDVLAANNDGNIAVIHGFACAEPGCSSTSGAAFTGFASGISVVPEPASLLLFGTGLLALPGYGLIRRRKMAE